MAANVKERYKKHNMKFVRRKMKGYVIDVVVNRTDTDSCKINK